MEIEIEKIGRGDLVMGEYNYQMMVFEEEMEKVRKKK